MDGAAVHWFWSLIALAAVVWYSTVTVYIAIRGTFDVRSMLQRLKQEHENATGSRQSD